MKKFLALAMGLCIMCSAQNADVGKLSEAFGHYLARNLEGPGFKFDLDVVIKGMRQAAAGEPAPMSDEELDRAMAVLQEKAFSNLANNNLDEANTFMKENGGKEAVVEVEAGKLQYRVEKAGDGAVVSTTDAPLVQYTGRYLDGTVFGSSTDPIALPIEQTIPGFGRGITGMKEGEKRTIFVHPDLGYGASGQLQPNSLLIFEVEVVKAKAEEALAAADTATE